MGVPIINKDYGIGGSGLGSPFFGKVPYRITLVKWGYGDVGMYGVWLTSTLGV